MKRELGRLPGVQEVRTDLEAQRVSVMVDVEQTTLGEVEKQLKSAGFPTK